MQTDIEQVPQNQANDHRSCRYFEFIHDVTEQAEAEHQHNVEDIIVDGKRADDAHDNNHRCHNGVFDLGHEDAHAGHQQADNEHGDVRQP